MIFSEITLVVCGLLFLFAGLTPLLNPFFRKIDFGNKTTPQGKEPIAAPPPLSVIITVHDNADDLSKHLPLFLSQDYPADFQVIIVMEKGDVETENVIKRFADNTHLYVTFIPAGSRYMSRKKLAVTVGVKASKYEWNILTDAFCSPQSDKWLYSMAENFTSSTNLVIGYSNYSSDSNAFQRFERLHTSYYLMRQALKGTAYRTNGTNLAFKKSEFISGGGYRGNLHAIRGEYDFLVNKFAHKRQTAIELRPQSWIKDTSPTHEAWINKHLFYLNSRKFLRRSRRIRALFNIDMSAMLVNYMFIVVAIVYSLIQEDWIICSVAGLSLLITFILRIHIAGKALSRFGEKISPFKIIPFEFGIIVYNIAHLLKYKKADKYDFTTHKL